MTDADRLREAARVSEERAAGLDRYDPDAWADAQELRAQAELLRAVADDSPCYCHPDSMDSLCRWHNVAIHGHVIVVAALALADRTLESGK